MPGRSAIPRALLTGLLALGPIVPAWASGPAGVEEETPEVTTPPRLLAPVPLEWPEDATEADAGTVHVRIAIDAQGVVTAVEVMDGAEVLRPAAERAASRLEFAPATRDGEAVSSATMVRFDFAPPAPFPEDVLDDEGELIVVHGADPDQEDTRARTTLDEVALERTAGGDLAEAVGEVPGLTVARGSADVAKPILRGLTERRLLVLFDGIRHESQKWGSDHATEIDPFAAGSVSVVRGAAGAIYGPDAIGGVILVEPPPLRDAPGVGGRAVASLSTNGWRPYGAVRVDVVPAALPALTLRVEGNYGRGAALSAPDYVLGNTGSEQWNVGLTAGWRWDSGSVRLAWHHYDLRAGVFYGVQNSSPAAFEDQLTADRPPGADLWKTSYAIDRPYQDVTHDIASAHAVVLGGFGTLEASYAFQLDHRLELDQVRESVTDAQYDFTLRTHALDASWTHPERAVGPMRLKGGASAQGSFQENVYRGLPLIPSFRSFAGGVGAWERAAFERADLELGARYDHLSCAAFLGEQEYDRHVRRGTLDGDTCEDRGEVSRCPAAYDAGSVSLGGLVHVVPSRLDLKIDLSSASRFPNVDELYLAGSAPTLPVYALGSPSLGVETTWSGSLTLGLRLRPVEAEVSGFGSYVHHFIGFLPDRNEDGSLHYDVTARGAWPTYGYEALDAAVYGTDGRVSFGPTAPVGVDLSGALVRIRDVATGEVVVGTPADRMRVRLIGRPPRLGPLRDNALSVSVERVARAPVAAEADFAPPPDGYVLLDLGAETRVAVGERSVRIGFDAFNLLNARYREYTSLMRYYADAPGRDFRLRVGVDL